MLEDYISKKKIKKKKTHKTTKQDNSILEQT